MIHQFILGSKADKSEAHRRKAILSTYLVLTYAGVDLFFFIINLYNPEGRPAFLLIGFFTTLMCLVLLRYKQTNVAIVLHLIRCNGLSFFFSMVDQDPLKTGTYLLFIPASLGALALFGYKDRWTGIGFSLLSSILFLIAIFDPSDFSPDQAHFYLIINFLITLVIGCIILVFFDRLAIQSENEILKKNDELLKINSELDRFVYSASHDLRAPLSSISGLIQLSEKSTNTDETLNYLKLMKGCITRLEHFIRDIINFSRNARTEVVQETVYLKELVQETFNELKFITGTDALVLKDELPEGLIIITDKVRLQVVLFNLISNSIQYRDKYKDVSFIRFTGSLSPNGLILHVDDNGVGIDKVHQEKVFNMFYRASENSKGSGLGLYIVREAMDKLGGAITLRSELGEGTHFDLELPLQRS
jgi:signal transduction histidine kinase